MLTDLQIEPSDDILIASLSLQPFLPLSLQFKPILSEHYSGTEIDHIDQLQSSWRRSLTFALQDRFGDRLYDLLICIREGMINAFAHGCERSADKFSHLQISINEESDLLRVIIDDPGRGHSVKVADEGTDSSDTASKGLGLGIIKKLSNNMLIDNRGTSLLFDFNITPDAPESGAR